MALWTPGQITTELWLDAADTSSITSSSGTASQWNDKSGNNRHATQSDSAKRPGTGSVNQNGNNVLVFDGSNDFLTINLSLSQPRTYYVVAQTNINTGSTGSRQYVFDGRDSGGIKRNLFALRGNQTNKPSVWAGSWLPHANNTTTEFDLFRCTFNGNSSVIGINADDDTGAAGSNNQSEGLVIGSNYAYNADFLSGYVAEIITCSASDEIVGYLAHKWGLSAKLPSGHPYKSAAPTIPDTEVIRAILSMPYALEGSLRGLCSTDYHILREFLSTCDQVYGIRLLAALVQRYGDVPQLRAILDQIYGSAAVLRRICRQDYGDALRLVAELDQRWSQYADLRALVEQKYSISGEELRRILSQDYDLRQYADLRAVLDQVYVVAPGTAIEQRPEVSVTSGVLTLSPHHISIEADEGSYFIAGEIHLADEAEFLQLAHLQEVAVRIDDATFSLLANLPRGSLPEVGRDDFVVPLASPSILLDAPYAEALTREFSGAMASAIATEMAATAGIDIDWQLVDWYLPSATLYANGETPLAIIRKLVEAVGGVLQSAPDGTLICRPEYPQSLPERATAVPVAYLTDQDNFFSVDSAPEIRDGFNRFLVSDQGQSAADTGLTLEQRDIDELTKEILVYRVPWTGQDIILHTSGGGWVRIVDEGVVEEVLTETVEIVSGEGRVAKPIYEKISQTYKQASLGAITTAEDGHLATEVAGNSLVEITYRTRYHLFTISSDRIEEVQFYPEELSL